MKTDMTSARVLFPAAGIPVTNIQYISHTSNQLFLFEYTCLIVNTQVLLTNIVKKEEITFYAFSNPGSFECRNLLNKGDLFFTGEMEDDAVQKNTLQNIICCDTIF